MSVVDDVKQAENDRKPQAENRIERAVYQAEQKLAEQRLGRNTEEFEHGRVPAQGARRPSGAPRRLRLLLHERVAALIERTEGFVGGDGRQRGKIIPFVLRFVRRVHLHQERSEEHTSELQSLMRISYAVFCLK